MYFPFLIACDFIFNFLFDPGIILENRAILLGSYILWWYFVIYFEFYCYEDMPVSSLIFRMYSFFYFIWLYFLIWKSSFTIPEIIFPALIIFLSALFLFILLKIISDSFNSSISVGDNIKFEVHTMDMNSRL